MSRAWIERRPSAHWGWAALAAVPAAVIGGCWPLDYSERDRELYESSAATGGAGGGAGHFPLGTTVSGPFGTSGLAPHNVVIEAAGPSVKLAAEILP
jgi:hypothetical protein